MTSLTIRTNNVPRPIIDAYELTNKERKEFDYIDWDVIDNGEDFAAFFRFKGQLYDLGEFMRIEHNEALAGWDGYSSDSAFSGVLIKWIEDSEFIIVGQYFS